MDNKLTPEQAFDRQLIEQLGSACLMIAKQVAAVTALQNQLDVATAKIAELEGKQPLRAVE